MGVGPRADGTLPDEVVLRLQEIGKWMDKNGAAIYNTRTTKYYNDGNTFFTASRTGDLLYALTCLEEGEDFPSTVSWTGNLPAKGSRMRLMATGKNVSWKTEGNRVVVSLPASLRKEMSTAPALAFSFKPEE